MNMWLFSGVSMICPLSWIVSDIYHSMCGYEYFFVGGGEGIQAEWALSPVSSLV
jgi:hypothetical protein